MVSLRRLMFVLLALVLALAITGVVLASYSFPVVNPTFDTDISGWNGAGCDEHFEWVDYAYRTAPGGLYATHYPDSCWITQTVILTQTGRYTLAGYVFVGWEGESVYCRFDEMVPVTVTVSQGNQWNLCEVVADLGAGEHVLGFRLSDFSGWYLDDVSLDVSDINPAHQILIPLSSGKEVLVNYSFTFGEMAFVCALLLLDVLFAARWMYDVALQIWRIT